MKRMHQRHLAERWLLSERTLEAWRSQGKGPRYMKIGGRCVYRLEDVEAYEAAHLHANTSGPLQDLEDGGAR